MKRLVLAVLITAAAYPFTLRYVAGYLDMTAWANPNTTTNLTTGVVGMFCSLGFVIGWGMPKILIRLKYFRERKTLTGIVTASTTMVAIMAFVNMLGLVGLPGVK